MASTLFAISSLAMASNSCVSMLELEDRIERLETNLKIYSLEEFMSNPDLQLYFDLLDQEEALRRDCLNKPLEEIPTLVILETKYL